MMKQIENIAKCKECKKSVDKSSLDKNKICIECRKKPSQLATFGFNMGV